MFITAVLGGRSNRQLKPTLSQNHLFPPQTDMTCRLGIPSPYHHHVTVRDADIFSASEKRLWGVGWAAIARAMSLADTCLGPGLGRMIDERFNLI